MRHEGLTKRGLCVRRQKPRAHSQYNQVWWRVDENRNAMVLAAHKMCLDALNADEREMRNGKGCYAPIRIRFGELCARFPNVVLEYERDHERPLTAKILGDRVHKMYHLTRPEKNMKIHQLTSEHPDNRRDMTRAYAQRQLAQKQVTRKKITRKKTV